MLTSIMCSGLCSRSRAETVLITPKQTQAEVKKAVWVITGMALRWEAHLFVDLKMRVSLSLPTVFI